MVSARVVTICKYIKRTCEALIKRSATQRDVWYLEYLSREIDTERLDAEEWRTTKKGKHYAIETETGEVTKGNIGTTGVDGEFSNAVKEGAEVPKYFATNSRIFKTKPRPYSEIKSEGANKIKNGFTRRALDGHWYGSDTCHSHREDYESMGINKQQYEERAKKLLGSKCGARIRGYKRNNGELVRFDYAEGEMVIGHPDLGITTLFILRYPDAGSREEEIALARQYFENRKRKEASK